MESGNGSKAGVLFTVLLAVFVFLYQAEGPGGSARAETIETAKDIEAVQAIRRPFTMPAVNFAEVEIVPSEQLSVADISALPRAPGNDPEVLSGPTRVRVQLSAGQVQALVEAGAEVTVLREFLLFEGFAADGEAPWDDPTTKASCTGDYLYGASSPYMGIPLGNWAGSPIHLWGAPAGSKVTCVDVHYEVDYYPWSYLYVDLTDSDYNFNVVLYNSFYDGGYLNVTSTGITRFYGRQPNQMWVLWAGNGGPMGGGVLTHWWIKVYHWIPHHCDAGSAACREYISGVEVGDISNTGTGCSQYANYTSQSTTMEEELCYPITVTNGNPQAGDECGVWVDWNKDWDFEDPCESFSVSGSPGPGPYTATIVPPADTDPGNKRMRIRVCSAGTPSPCGDAAYGEVEDYTINVIPAPTYCGATTVYCGWEYISNVEVGDISNTTDCSRYAYYPSMATAMEVGTSYPITVTNGYPDPVDECGIWVDWNRDGDFDDASETISVSGSPGEGPYTGTIAPPGTAAEGGCRLRVRICDGTPGPCGACDFGEVEDYVIIIAEAPSFVTISGLVKTSGTAAIEGVLVSASTGESNTTDAGGFYELEVSEPWTGTVTPSMSYWSFSPANRSYSGITTDQPGQDYTGTYTAEPNPTISGYIKMGEGHGIEEVQVSASTGESTTTGDGGYYELTVSSGDAVPEPWSGTVTPSKDLWSFSAANIVYSDLTADIADQNYAGTYLADPTPTISGYVKTAGGAGVEGVLVFADHLGGSAITEASGYYELTVPDLVRPVPEPWSGTVTPVKTDWSFGPVNRVHSDLSSDIGNQNYTGSYVGIGCAAGWLEEWVAWYHGREIKLYPDEARDIGVDGAGNIYVTGLSYGENTSSDYATVKYDSDGTELWVARYNGPASGGDGAQAMVLDAMGNVYVTGESYGGDNGEDYLTIKYGPDSNVAVWVARYNGPDNEVDEAEAIAVDDSGNVYVTGYSWEDMVTIKYEANGNESWVARYYYPGGSSGSAVAVDDSGKVYVTGSSRGAGTSEDIVTIKYEADGDEAWAARYNGPGNGHDFGEALAIDGSGNIYVTGASEGTGTSGDICTIKYDANGNEVWVAKYGGPGSDWDSGYKIILDHSGNIYVSGVVSGSSQDYATIKYGPESNEPEWVALYDGPKGVSDVTTDIALDDSGNVYVTGTANIHIPGIGDPEPPSGNFATIKYGPDSNEPLWIAEYDGPPNGIDMAGAIALDSSGNMYVTGIGDGYVTVKYSQCPVLADLELNNSWMYQSMPGKTGSTLTAGVSVTDDPMGNSSYSYAWEIILPGDVSLAPTTAAGGGAGDASWTLAARACDEPGGLSDSGQTFKVRVRITGDDYGNTGQAEAEFGIALLGDVNNDGIINVADRSIANAFWRLGSVGTYTLRDCDVNSDGIINVADRSIANAVWRGLFGQNFVSNPCPLR